MVQSCILRVLDLSGTRQLGFAAIRTARSTRRKARGRPLQASAGAPAESALNSSRQIIDFVWKTNSTAFTVIDDAVLHIGVVPLTGTNSTAFPVIDDAVLHISVVPLTGYAFRSFRLLYLHRERYWTRTRIIGANASSGACVAALYRGSVTRSEISRLDLQSGFSFWYLSRHGQYRFATILIRMEQRGLAHGAEKVLDECSIQRNTAMVRYDTSCGILGRHRANSGLPVKGIHLAMKEGFTCHRSAPGRTDEVQLWETLPEPGAAAMIGTPSLYTKDMKKASEAASVTTASA